MLANQRDEHDRPQVLAPVLRLSNAGDAHQVLCATRPDRHHEPAADRELLEQGRWQIRTTRCDDRVKWRTLRPAEGTISAQDLDVL
jgi:hypothetical protein